MFSSAWELFREHASRPAYRQLEDSRTIRLIQLIPDSSLVQGFRISLQHFSLDKTPQFDVLSYTRGEKYVQSVVDEWDREAECSHFDAYKPAEQRLVDRLSSMLLVAVPDEAPNNIKVNDSRLTIHSDVLAFLKFMLDQQTYLPQELFQANPDRKMEKHTDTFLWVDCICINQKDIEERGRQTTLLSSIYKASQRTIVWLSQHEPPDPVHRAMSDLAPKFLQFSQENDPDYILKNDPLRVRPEMKEALGEQSANDWEQVMLHFWVFIARHQYFSEGWVQEVLLSPHAVVMCGNQTWDWSTLEHFMRLVVSVVDAPSKDPDPPTSDIFKDFKHLILHWRRALAHMMFLSSLRRFWMGIPLETRRDDLVTEFGPLEGKKEVYCQILKMMRLLQGRTFEDKRDHIYGWLGLTTLILPNGKIFGSPNYNLSVPAVYSGFAKSIMKGCASLDILNDVEDAALRKLSPGLPSWVPDFSVPTYQFPFHRLDAAHARRDIDATLTRSSKTSRLIEFEGDTLLVSGVRLDRISHRGPQLFYGTELVGTMDIDWFFERLLAMKSYEPTGQSPAEALCYALAGGALAVSGPAGLEEMFRSLWSYILRRRKKQLLPTDAAKLTGLLTRLEDSDKGRQWLPPSAIMCEPDGSSSSENQQALEHGPATLRVIPKLWLARAPLVSSSGYWGLCHRSARAGDEIWLLDGGKTPYILRRREDGAYRFMGESYVHGFMHGEGWSPEFCNKRQVRIV